MRNTKSRRAREPNLVGISDWNAEITVILLGNELQIYFMCYTKFEEHAYGIILVVMPEYR